MAFKLDSLESYTVEEMTTTSNIVVQSQGTFADRKSIKKIASVKRHDSEADNDGIKKSKKRKKHKRASDGDKILNTESSKVSEGSRRHEKSLLLYYKRTGKSWKRGYMLNEVKTDEDKGDETDEETSDTEEEIRVVKVCEWVDPLAKLWNRDPEYLDRGQNDDVKKEKKEKSSKKVKLSVEDVKIDNPNAVSKFRINPLREKLQATIFDMVLGGATNITTHGLDINDIQLIIQCESPRDIVCTHGRMIDILCTSSEKITNLQRATFLVMYEADRMFDMGFEPQIICIIQTIRHDQHTVLFSATFPRQDETLARKVLNKPIEIQVGGRSVVNKDITQLVEVRPKSERFLRLLEILGEWYEKRKILVFVQSQKKCDALLKDLFKKIYHCISLHGGNEQSDQESTISDFKSNVCNILIATSVAARGIDVKELELVVNYDAPNHYEYYVHRIGRTGRAEQKGCAVTFISEDDAKYAPYLVKALELSLQPIPDDLKEIADSFIAKVRQGTEQAHETGYVDSGLKFTEEEEKVTKAAKKAQAKEYGFEEYKSDSEDEIDVVRKACVVGVDTSAHQAALAHIATIAAAVKANAAAMNPPVTTNQLLPNGGGLTSLPKVIAKDEPIEESSQFLVDSDDASDKESDTKEPLRTRKKASPAAGSSDVEEGKTEKNVRQRTVKKDKDVEDGLVTTSSTYDEVSDAEKALAVKATDADNEGEEIDLSKHESEDISHTYGWPPLVCCFGSAKNVFVPSGRPANRFLDCKFKTVEARVEAFHRKEEELKKELEIVKNQHASDSAVLLLVTRELEKVSLKLAAANDAKNLPLSQEENISKMISIHAEKETISNKEIDVLKSELEKARSFEAEVKERDEIIEKIDAAKEVFKMAKSHAYGFADQWCTKAIELEEQLEETNMMKKYASVSLVSLIKQLEGSNTRLQVMECEVIALKDKAKLMATVGLKQSQVLKKSEHLLEPAEELLSKVEKEDIKLKTKLEIFKDEKSKTLSELERSKEEEEKSEPDMQSLASVFHQASSERVLKNRLLSLGGQNYKTREEDKKLVIKSTNEKYEKMLHEVEQTNKPFESSRGIVEDLLKMEFKLKGENVGLSLKKKGNLINKLTSNPTKLWFKGLGNMLYLMSLGNLFYI